MIRLLGQNAGLLSNALEVGKYLLVDDRWPAAPCSIPMSFQGQTEKVSRRAILDRFTIESGHTSHRAGWRLRAADIKAGLLDHLVCGGEQIGRHGKAERLWDVTSLAFGIRLAPAGPQCLSPSKE
jgi:hypothetical protein